MITLLTTLDEHKSLDTLPAYVASGPDKMPSLRLYEGDFGVLLAMMRKMNDQLAMNGSAITALARDISALQAVVRPPESCSGPPPVPAHRPQPVVKVTVDSRGGALNLRTPPYKNGSSICTMSLS